MKEHKNQYIIKAIVGILCLLLIATLMLWALWNWLVPEIFGLKRLSFVEAGGLLLLSKLLLGGFNKEHFKKKMSSEYWESKFVSHKESNFNLTDEQKSILKDKLRNKWCSPEKEKKQNIQV